MKETIQVINEMQTAGVIGRYAIGGAVGATFYVQAVSTEDIDIFIPFENQPESQLASMSHLYGYLLPRGHKAAGAHFVIKGWQVQFLPADDTLYKEALNEAVAVEFEGIKTFVMTAEHLMAISLRTGRPKDYARLQQFWDRKSPTPGSTSSPLKSVAEIARTASKTLTQTVILNAPAKRIFDEVRLNDILARHGLVEKWNKFKLEHLES